MPTRESIREGTQHLFCQHCRAIQKVMNVQADCRYNPLDKETPAFCSSNEDFTTQHFKDMDSQGAVLKVERELPKLSLCEFEEWCGNHTIKGCGRTKTMCEDYCHPLALIEKAGYVAVESLVEASHTARDTSG